MSIGSFRSHVRDKAWALIDWIHQSPKEQAELLQLLREVVRKVTIENGMEQTTRFATPDEVGRDENLKAASRILYEGELEALVEGNPPTAGEAWKSTVAQISTALREMENEGEVTKGDTELGRIEHLKRAREMLDSIEVDTNDLCGQCDSEEEKVWLTEALSGIADLALNCGRHFQVACSKSFESDAVRGEKVAGGSRNSAHQTNSTHEPLRERRLTRLKELRFPNSEEDEPAMTLAAACKICVKEGLGPAANVRQT